MQVEGKEEEPPPLAPKARSPLMRIDTSLTAIPEKFQRARRWVPRRAHAAPAAVASEARDLLVALRLRRVPAPHRASCD